MSGDLVNEKKTISARYYSDFRGRFSSPRIGCTGKIGEALDLILRSKGGIKICNVCARLDLNVKTLERRFKNTLGITPKEFAAAVRVAHACSLMKSEPRYSTQEIVFACGYYDQAHFINEFKRFTSLTPSAFINLSVRSLM